MQPREIHFPAKDAALRDDVRELGGLVGDVLVEQGGRALFERVEAARLAAIGRRESGGDLLELGRQMGDLTPGEAEALVRGFSTYFQVVNIAESVHRVRRRREYLRTSGPAQAGSLEELFGDLRRSGRGLAELGKLLGRLRIEPVFTAHPTEATRRLILEKQQRIARRLVERMDPSMTPDEQRVCRERIRTAITATWQTEEYPTERPSVIDEMEHVLFYVIDVLYRAIPVFYESIEASLERAFGAAARSTRVPSFVRFASWVGGDMDGNPNVSAETIRAALKRHRSLLLSRYRGEIQRLAGSLTQSVSRVGVDPEIRERIERHAEALSDKAVASPRHRDMPYRTLLMLVARRLEATRRDRPGAYGSVGELEQDIKCVLRSLEDNLGRHAGAFGVHRLLRRLETFGFHLATLDVRQDARVHRERVAQLIGDAGWGARPAAERAARLEALLVSGAAPPASPDPASRRALEVFEAIAEARKEHGVGSIGPFIVSMTQGADDVLSVLLLARWGGLEDERGGVAVDVAPLFETVDDLDSSERIMRDLYASPVYRAHVAARGDRQLVMIGYSDSNKDSGFAASRWALHRAQATLVASRGSGDPELIFFHGRGGTISRGGGKVQRAMTSSPRGAIGGYLRVTEQGEAINARYGLRHIALRNLEVMSAAVARATALPDPEDTRENQAIMDLVAKESRAAYRTLIEADGFLDYFRSATPIDVIERMPIGSRPAARAHGRGLDSLRAIPWVFAWSQSRHFLPGWFGLGAGLAAAIQAHGETAVRGAFEGWGPARALIEDAEMVLAKTDMMIASGYADLADGATRHFFRRIEEAHRQTVRAILDLKRIDALLDEEPAIQRSIRLRNPYVDPMSTLQIDLLRRWREGGRSDPDLLRALLATVHGIAKGLHGTG